MDRGSNPPGTGSVPRAKICGLTRREDALLAQEAGADYLGIVMVPGTPRAVQVSEGEAIFRGLSSRKVVVVADASLDQVVEWSGGVGAQVIQLHGGEDVGFIRALRERGSWEIWRAVRVRHPAEVEEASKEFGGEVGGLLLDGWHPTMRGGSGTSFSWKEVAAVRGILAPGLRLIAAGGLHPGNVGEAIRHLAPDVVDVSSGVEKGPGIKDPEKVVDFIRAVKRSSQEGDV